MFRLTAAASFILIAGVFSARDAAASSTLLYLEAQGVAGYSTAHEGFQFYSDHQGDPMQKPSLGFDFVQRISGDEGDRGAFYLQARAAYDEEEKYKTEPQIYNAYLNLKTGPFDLWTGHNRPAFSMGAYYDNHAEIIPSPVMRGYSYDRDWGAGISKDTDWGSAKFSATTGSGMGIYFEGNYFLAGRISMGVPEQDNYTIAVSAGGGELLETMGYDLMMDEPMKTMMAAADFALFMDSLEFRGETIIRRIHNMNSGILSIRAGINFLEENRLKLEAQPMILFQENSSSRQYEVSAGMTFRADSEWTFRGLYHYTHETRDHRGVAQIYYYMKVI
jgi:hypothetical protein